MPVKRLVYESIPEARRGCTVQPQTNHEEATMFKQLALAVTMAMALSACGHAVKHQADTASGKKLQITGACATNPMSPSACAYVAEMEDGEGDWTLLRHTISSQKGWLDPSGLGAAALIGWGLSESGTEVNQEGGGASASANAEGGAGGKGGKSFSNSSSNSASYSNSEASASQSQSQSQGQNSTNVNVNSNTIDGGGGGGCFPPGLC